MPINWLKLAEFGRFVSGKHRFSKCADFEAKRGCADFEAYPRTMQSNLLSISWTFEASCFISSKNQSVCTTNVRWLFIRKTQSNQNTDTITVTSPHTAQDTGPPRTWLSMLTSLSSSIREKETMGDEKWDCLFIFLERKKNRTKKMNTSFSFFEDETQNCTRFFFSSSCWLIFHTRFTGLPLPGKNRVSGERRPQVWRRHSWNPSPVYHHHHHRRRYWSRRSAASVPAQPPRWFVPARTGMPSDRRRRGMWASCYPCSGGYRRNLATRSSPSDHPRLDCLWARPPTMRHKKSILRTALPPINHMNEWWMKIQSNQSINRSNK